MLRETPSNNTNRSTCTCRYLVQCQVQLFLMVIVYVVQHGRFTSTRASMVLPYVTIPACISKQLAICIRIRRSWTGKWYLLVMHAWRSPSQEGVGAYNHCTSLLVYLRWPSRCFFFLLPTTGINFAMQYRIGTIRVPFDFDSHCCSNGDGQYDLWLP